MLDQKGICMLPVSGTNLIPDHSPQSQGGGVPNDIWMKILSIIIESNRGTINSITSPFNISISLVCKTFYRMDISIFSFQTRLPFFFPNPQETSCIEEKSYQISNEVTCIHCDQEGNRYFYSKILSHTCVLNILQPCGSFISLDLSYITFSNGPIDKKDLSIISCMRYQDHLIIVSYRVVSVFNLDHESKFILDDNGHPQIASYFVAPAEILCHFNVCFYENRLFWYNFFSSNAAGDFLICDLADKQLKWVPIHIPLENPISRMAYPGFTNLDGCLYISYKENETLKSEIKTNSYFIPLDFDCANNSLREHISSTPFKITSCRPHYTREGYAQALKEGLDPGREYQAAVDANGGYLNVPTKNTMCWLNYPTNKNWMIDGSELNLQVIDLINKTVWISTESNIRSPDPLKQETIFLDENLLLVSYSNNSFRAIYLPTRNEVTRQLQKVFKTVLKHGYSLLSFYFKRSGKETTITLIQIQSPQKPPSPCEGNNEKPEKQALLTTKITLKDQDFE